VDIGYDRTINSQDMMGSYHWSGGFQEIENEGGEGMEIQKANSSSSEQRSSYDNGDPKKKDQQEGSSKENKGATVAGSAYSALGEHGQKSLESGEYTQTN